MVTWHSDLMKFWMREEMPGSDLCAKFDMTQQATMNLKSGPKMDISFKIEQSDYKSQHD